MKHIKSIYEYRYQMEIPFEVGKHPIHDKPVHQHIIDVLEDLNTKTNPDNYYSIEDIDELWNENEDKAREVYVIHTNDVPIGAINIFLNKYPISENPECYSDMAKAEYEDFETLLYDMEGNPAMYLSEEGEDKMDEALDEYFSDALNELNVKRTLENYQDEYGLIPIYRAITYYKSEFGDEFENAIHHGGVGLFWSWEESGAYPFGGGNKGDTYILHGKVKPENVNWIQTIFKSAWELRHEKEIEIKKRAEILIYGISKWGDDDKFTNIKPIVVPA